MRKYFVMAGLSVLHLVAYFGLALWIAGHHELGRVGAWIFVGVALLLNYIVLVLYDSMKDRFLADNSFQNRIDSQP